MPTWLACEDIGNSGEIVCRFQSEKVTREKFCIYTGPACQAGLERMSVQEKWTKLLSLLMSAMAELYLPCGKADLRSNICFYPRQKIFKKHRTAGGFPMPFSAVGLQIQ